VTPTSRPERGGEEAVCAAYALTSVIAFTFRLRVPLRLLCVPAFVFVFADNKPEAPPETTDSITFALAAIYFLRFQPKNRMSSPKTI
jgi:hypothetical protein